MEFQTLRQAIDNASLDLDENLTTTKRALREISEQMLTYIKQETRVFRRLERVCNEFRGPW